MSLEISDVEKILYPSIRISNYFFRENGFNTLINGASQPSIFFYEMTTKIHESMDIYLEPQEEGGFVAFSKEYQGAVGQGETEEKAIRDLQEAIKLLKEVSEEETK
mgnify:FL=1